MIIQHNLLAANADRQYGITSKLKGKWMERLSSGYRINRAADDASGLSISEEMRGQIRGLNRAADNVLEGINLIRTADGAMAEQTAMLQRLREITVQSYNDTYTQDDRLKIQYEADALLEEIDRVRNDTEYNTIKILQGDRVKEWTEKIVIEPSEEFSKVPIVNRTSTTLPPWVTAADELTIRPSLTAAVAEQDTTAVVVFNMNQVEDPTEPSRAFGPEAAAKPQAQIYGGPWSEGLQDNYSASVDFSALARASTKAELIEKLQSLAGTGVGYECYSCEMVQGVAFASSDISVERVYNTERADYFPVIQLDSFINAGIQLDESDPEAFKAGAETITKKLITEIVNRTKYNGHFVRTTENKTNPYEVIFYDLRDKNSLQYSKTPENERKGKVLKDSIMDLRSYVEVKNEAVTFYENRSQKYDYVIQAGANSKQLVDLKLPDTSVAALGLTDYSVFWDGYCSSTPDKKWDPSLAGTAEKIGEHLYRGYVGGVTTYEEKTIDKEYDIPITLTEPYIVTPAWTDSNGEFHRAVMGMRVTGTDVRHISIHGTYTETHTSGGSWQTFEGYLPDRLTRVDEALRRLTNERVRLGALENRLEHTWLNDENEAENLQSAESKIRDTDMAKGMVENAKLDILMQAGQSMIAQANQSTQGILQLLR